RLPPRDHCRAAQAQPPQRPARGRGRRRDAHAMKVRANGLEINYVLEGPAAAPVVTLSHSIAADLTMWDPTVPALTGRYRVLRYDVRGHGGSEAAPGEYSLE